jgi:alkyl hydroperoxide reductase subunit AhpC
MTPIGQEIEKDEIRAASSHVARRQQRAKHKVATPVNWRPGEEVIIAGSVSDEEARQV